ncbi:MAG: lamin tail domain-containing protein [Bacteroidota bacterium]|nr:lamin tail domain-containing protein [Bacteroidota bacterium]
MRIILVLLSFLVITYQSYSQLVENFSDGEFSSNPSWVGDSGDFTVNGVNQLQLNGTVAGTSYLVTASNLASLNNAEWNINVRLAFSPSTSNLARIYLVSDQQNLKGSLNGYYLQLGEANNGDVWELFKQTGGTRTSIMRGVTTLTSTNNNVDIKVTRDNNALWSLYVKTATGGTFGGAEATATDNAFNSSSYFGIVSIYTITNKSNFYFDNITVTSPPDLTKPSITGINVLSLRTLQISFNESISSSTGTLSGNYIANGGLNNPSSTTISGANVIIGFATTFTGNQTYFLTVSGISDLSSNIMDAFVTTFIYPLTVASPPPTTTSVNYRGIVINELMADLSPVPFGIPAYEYLELFNTTNQDMSLQGFVLQDGSTNRPFPSNATITSNGFLVIVGSSAALSAFQTAFPTINAISLSGFGLTDGGESEILISPASSIVDQVNYSTSYYKNSSKANGGWSIEQINPSITCTGDFNWSANITIAGITTVTGTPGRQNSVFSNAIDTQAPVIQSFKNLQTDVILVSFNETMDTISIKNSSYNFSNGANILGFVKIVSSVNGVLLQTDSPMDTTIAFTLTINGVKDCSGNLLTDNTYSFIPLAKPYYRQIVINEIMADINPAPTNIPAFEYMELYNNSNQQFNLSGYTLVDGATNRVFPSNVTIAPFGYLLIVGSSAAVSAFKTQFPALNIISLSGFGLTDGGENESLISPFGNIVDQITYKTSWYSSSFYSNGGYSLELKNPAITCSGTLNWTNTNDTKGGTPGAQNSVYNTNPDVVGPSITGVSILNSTQIKIAFSEPMDTLSLRNGTYTFNGGLTSTSVTVLSATDSILINLNNSIVIGQLYTVTGTGLKDCAGNLIVINKMMFVQGKEPLAGDLIINEIMSSPTGSQFAVEYIELYNKANQVLNLENVFIYDATTSSNSSPIQKGAFILPGEYVILASLNNYQLLSSYGRGLYANNFPSLNDDFETISLRDVNGNIIDKVAYSKAWYKDASKASGGFSLERINPITPCSGVQNWAASIDSKGGTPGQVNSIYSTAPDIIAPSITGVFAISNNVIKIAFTEPMNSFVLQNGTYILSDGLAPLAAKVSADADSVTISITGALLTGKAYTVSPQGLKDCIGNILSTTSIAFGIGKAALKNDFVINEIFADESPSVGLPEAEFIELFNNTSDVINIGGDTLSDATFKTVFPLGSVIMPNGYLIICAATNAGLYQSYGRVLGLTAFPGLNNTGEKLTIKEPGGKVITTVTYSDSWYKDSKKSEGGYTLERINAKKDCGGIANWAASNASKGGTPGALNSLSNAAPDTEKPFITGTLLKGNILKIAASEGLDTTSAKVANFVPTGNAFNINNASLKGPNGDTLELTLNNSLKRSVLYSLKISNLYDCAFNNSSNVNVSFGNGKPPKKFEVVINEILPDENPSVGLPEAEFIELYNTTDSIIDLSNCRLYDASGFGKFPASNVLILPKDYLILASTTNSEKFKYFGKSVGITSFPSLNSDKDNLKLTDQNSNLISRVDYSDAWYNDAIKQNGGWSLEKVDPLNPCGGITNWRVSVDPKGGTPGKLNSVNASNPDNEAPQLMSAFAVAKDTLVMNYNEIIDSLSALTATITLSDGLLGTAKIVGSQSVIAVIQPDVVRKKTYTVSVSNLSDCAGNFIGNANKADFVLAEQGLKNDVYVNEILFNPKPNGVDFIEIYNVTDKNINLKNWTLGNVDTKSNSIDNLKPIITDNYLLKPLSYAVFTTNKDGVKNFYPKAKDSTFIIMNSYPSYTDDEGTVVVMNNLLQTVDSVYYNDNFHQSLLDDKEGVSLEKIDFAITSNSRTSWQSASAASGYATPGYLNSQYKQIEKSDKAVVIDPQVFTPDGDGYLDFTTIQYKFENGGNTGNFTIYDSEGRVIRRLVKNEIMGTSGIYTWNGEDEDGKRSRIGYYMLYIEIFDNKGNVKSYREKVVVAGKL